MGAGCARGTNAVEPSLGDDGKDAGGASSSGSPAAAPAAAAPAPAASSSLKPKKAVRGEAASKGAEKSGSSDKPARPPPGSYRAAPVKDVVEAPGPPNTAVPRAQNGARGTPAEPVAGLRALGFAEASETEVEVADRPQEKTVVKAPLRGKRCFSVKSENALTALNVIEVRLKQIEDRVAELDTFVRELGAHAPSGSFLKPKSELAQLEADAHKLESTGVDNIYTSELESGKASAKETKKEQLRRLEVLFDRIDKVFGLMPKGAGGGAATLPGSPQAPMASPHIPHSSVG